MGDHNNQQNNALSNSNLILTRIMQELTKLAPEQREGYLRRLDAQHPGIMRAVQAALTTRLMAQNNSLNVKNVGNGGMDQSNVISPRPQLNNMPNAAVAAPLLSQPAPPLLNTLPPPRPTYNQLPQPIATNMNSFPLTASHSNPILTPTSSSTSNSSAQTSMAVPVSYSQLLGTLSQLPAPQQCASEAELARSIAMFGTTCAGVDVRKLPASFEGIPVSLSKLFLSVMAAGGFQEVFPAPQSLKHDPCYSPPHFLFYTAPLTFL